MMKRFGMIAATLLVGCSAHAAGPGTFDSKWIPARPEMLTYKITGSQGDGLYQLSVSHGDSTIEVFLNIVTVGFTKTVSAIMRLDMKLLQSTSKIIVDGQIIMDTRCVYDEDTLHVVTDMQPYHQRVEADLAVSRQFVDFSQIPFILRTLPLKPGREFSFPSLNPKTNTTTPFTAIVTGDGLVHAIDCYKVETKDFEGESVYWLEKTGQKRILRIEQPASGRVTELIW